MSLLELLKEEEGGISLQGDIKSSVSGCDQTWYSSNQAARYKNVILSTIVVNVEEWTHGIEVSGPNGEGAL